MPVPPEDVAVRGFRRRLWRGYDRSEVEAFLRQVAGDYAGAIDRIAAVAQDRTRAEQVATMITNQAEEAANALIEQSRALRAAAQADADAARERLADADRRAQQLEDAARARWEAQRVETERRWDQLHAAERRFAERIQQAHTSLDALRSQLALLDQVHQLEQDLSALRTDTQLPRSDAHPAGGQNGATDGVSASAGGSR